MSGMVASEQEMVRRDEEAAGKERVTSLQPTYEDSVPPDQEIDWEHEDQ